MANTNSIFKVKQTSAVIPDEPIFRLSVRQYLAMAEAGLLQDEIEDHLIDNAVELLDGWLVATYAKTPQHSITTQIVYDFLHERLKSAYFVWRYVTVVTSHSVPEPDVAVFRSKEEFSKEGYPQAEEVCSVIEVADASLRRDRTTKLSIYAQAGIPIYWIVNLVDRQIEVFSEPKDGSYQKQQIYAETGMIPVAIEQVQIAEVAVRDLLP